MKAFLAFAGAGLAAGAATHLLAPPLLQFVLAFLAALSVPPTKQSLSGVQRDLALGGALGVVMAASLVLADPPSIAYFKERRVPPALVALASVAVTCFLVSMFARLAGVREPIIQFRDWSVDTVRKLAFPLPFSPPS